MKSSVIMKNYIIVYNNVVKLVNEKNQQVTFKKL